MSEKGSREARILKAHQELVEHVERGSSLMRGLSGVTIVVALVLALSYILQLTLPLTGVNQVTVVLTDPGNIAAELVVAALSVVWLYVGVRDYRFASKMRKAIAEARSSEDEMASRAGVSGAEVGKRDQ